MRWLGAAGLSTRTGTMSCSVGTTVVVWCHGTRHTVVLLLYKRRKLYFLKDSSTLWLVFLTEGLTNWKNCRPPRCRPTRSTHPHRRQGFVFVFGCFLLRNGHWHESDTQDASLHLPCFGHLNNVSDTDAAFPTRALTSDSFNRRPCRRTVHQGYVRGASFEVGASSKGPNFWGMPSIQRNMGILSMSTFLVDDVRRGLFSTGIANTTVERNNGSVNIERSVTELY